MIGVEVWSGVGRITLKRGFAHVIISGFAFSYVSTKVFSKKIFFKLVTML